MYVETRSSIDFLFQCSSHVEIDVGDFWTIDVDYGDFWTQHKALASLAAGTRQARVVDAFGASLRRIEQSAKLDQATYLKLQGELEAIIDWLGELQMTAA